MNAHQLNRLDTGRSVNGVIDSVISLQSALTLILSHISPSYGAIQVLRNAVGGGGGVSFPGKKRYKGAWFNVISVYEGVGQISRKKVLRNI